MKKIVSIFLLALLLVPMGFVNAGNENNNYAKQFSGKILLAVEDNGKAYYVDFNGNAHYLKDADSAFEIFKSLAKGINKSGSDKIAKNTKWFNLQYKGKLFLAAEAGGEIYYLDFNGNAHLLKDGLTAFRIMNGLSIGISNEDLAKINIDNGMVSSKGRAWREKIGMNTNEVVEVAIVNNDVAVVADNNVAVVGGEEVDSAKKFAKDFIDNNLLSGGEVEITSINLEKTYIYKLNLLIDGQQDIVSYMTQDGKLFFPQVMDIAEVEKQTKATKENKVVQEEKEVAGMVKLDKPVIELFVMSHCPFGTQIEKGILPVVTLLGDKIDYELKFVDYVMHGKKEIDEQLIQYCIQKDEPTKFNDYLACFLSDGESAPCVTDFGINQAGLDTCVSATDTEFNITELYNDESTWSGGRFPQFNIHKVENEKYGVGGSPTLIINGVEANSGRSSASLLKTICNSFTEAPSECDEELSSENPSSGFGYGTTTNNTDSSCN